MSQPVALKWRVVERDLLTHELKEVLLPPGTLFDTPEEAWRIADTVAPPGTRPATHAREVDTHLYGVSWHQRIVYVGATRQECHAAVPKDAQVLRMRCVHERGTRVDPLVAGRTKLVLMAIYHTNDVQLVQRQAPEVAWSGAAWQHPERIAESVRFWASLRHYGAAVFCQEMVFGVTCAQEKLHARVWNASAAKIPKAAALQHFNPTIYEHLLFDEDRQHLLGASTSLVYVDYAPAESSVSRRVLGMLRTVPNKTPNEDDMDTWGLPHDPVKWKETEMQIDRTIQQTEGVLVDAIWKQETDTAAADEQMSVTD